MYLSKKKKQGKKNSKRNGKKSKFGTRQPEQLEIDRKIKKAVQGLLKLNPINYRDYKKEAKLYRKGKLSDQKMEKMQVLFDKLHSC